MTSGATTAATTGAASVQRLHDGLDTGTVLSSAWLSAPARDAWPLCDHALRAPTSRQPYAPGDPGPGLVLVHDGVYLMSNGLPVQSRPDGAGAVTVPLSTPRGRVLRTWSESMTALCGGGDDPPSCSRSTPRWRARSPGRGRATGCGCATTVGSCRPRWGPSRRDAPPVRPGAGRAPRGAPVPPQPP